MATYPGVYSALVIDNRDPSEQARLKIRVPAVDPKLEFWARFASPMTGHDCGVVLVPAVGDEVVVAFEAGDLNFPIVLGALWNAQAAPPQESNQAGRVLLVRSRNGVALRIEDDVTRNRVVIETPAGQKVTLEDGPGQARVEDSNGNSIALSPSGVVINAASTVRVNAAVIELSAAMLAVDAGLARFSGVVKCDTLISNSVVASSYTPGAGNIW